MLSVRRPSQQLTRALSTPLQTPSSPAIESTSGQHNATVSALTPPISPISAKHSRSSSDLANMNQVLSTSDQWTSIRQPNVSIEDQSHDNLQPEACEQRTSDGILCCPFEIDSIQDARGRDQVFGTGAWSTVYKATPSRPATTSGGLLTPPSSPIAALPIIVAIKTPARANSKPILRNEASILSYLIDLPLSTNFIIPFYGISAESIVLGACPLSLEEHVRRCAISASQTRTTTTMHLPVLGSERIWLSLADQLISALAWLHDFAEVVHGDIKPGNILLDPYSSPTSAQDNHDSFPFRPLLIDFSSSHRANITTEDGTVPQGTLSAITREYTAPELLKSSVLRDPNSTATKASDVFSLAITLLVAATGNIMVYDGSVFQRQYMATQGWQAVSFVRSGSGGARVPRLGLVERVVEKALLKHDLGRITAEQWSEETAAISKGEPGKRRAS